MGGEKRKKREEKKRGEKRKITPRPQVSRDSPRPPFSRRRHVALFYTLGKGKRKGERGIGEEKKEEFKQCLT